MRLKSFFADTIEQAIAQAREQMGPDAMLVNSKRSGAETRHLGAYEVVVCSDENAGRHDAESDRSIGMQTLDGPTLQHLSRDVSDLKRQIERMAIALARSSSGLAGVVSDPQLAAALVALMDAEMDTDLSYELIGRISLPTSTNGLRAELKLVLRVDQDLGCLGAPAQVVALVGPPGSGKTSALIKLAVQYGVTARRPSQILSMDMHRIAAAEELQSYSAILGIGCQVLESPAALGQALEEHRNKSLILIDTPGLCRSEMETCHDLAVFLSSYRGLDTHLIVPASMRAADLRQIAGQYAVFKPRKLLITRVDETETFGPILSHSLRTGMPISFLCDGQRIPEDLHPATVDLLIDMLLKTKSAMGPRFDTVAA